MRFSARRMIRDGLVLGGLFTAVVVGSLWLDARIWIDDYPPDIRAAAGSAGEAPLALRLATAALLFGVLLGGVVYSNWMAARERGWTCRFGSVFLHTLGILWVINVVDVVIVDWLIFVAIQPRFVILPGTEGLAGYGDYRFHLEASVLSWQPWVASLAVAGLAAAVLPPLWRRRRRASEASPGAH